MDFIHNRFPRRSEIFLVFGVAVFVCHSWTLLGFFNKLPSFLLYFSTADIAGVFAYMMGFAFLESLAVTGFLVLLSALLPSSWLRDGFAYKGFVILAVATAASILFQKSLTDDFPSTFMLLRSFLLPLVLIAILIGVSQYYPKMQNILLDIQDRLSIMLYIFVPIGLLSILVVVFRNFL